MYLCLDHLHTLSPHVPDVAVDTHNSLSLHLLHDSVQEDEGPSTTHSSTAVDQEGNAFVLVVGLLHSPDEGDEGGGKLGDSVVRPGGEVVLGH